jgi:hypothetical protein
VVVGPFKGGRPLGARERRWRRAVRRKGRRRRWLMAVGEEARGRKQRNTGNEIWIGNKGVGSIKITLSVPFYLSSISLFLH